MMSKGHKLHSSVGIRDSLTSCNASMPITASSPVNCTCSGLWVSLPWLLPLLRPLLAALLLPAFAGMDAGRRLRQRLNEAAFRRVVQVALGLLGAWLAVRALA